jgi:hypothetical protein
VSQRRQTARDARAADVPRQSRRSDGLSGDVQRQSATVKMHSLAEGRQFDDSVLIAATTGAAGMAAYLATPNSIRLSFRLPFVYGWHRLIVRGRTWLWSRVRPVQHDVCRASSLLKGQQCVGTDARRPAKPALSAWGLDCNARLAFALQISGYPRLSASARSVPVTTSLRELLVETSSFRVISQRRALPYAPLRFVPSAPCLVPPDA